MKELMMRWNSPSETVMTVTRLQELLERWNEEERWRVLTPAQSARRNEVMAALDEALAEE